MRNCRKKAFIITGSAILIVLITLSVTQSVNVLMVEGDRSSPVLFGVRPGDTVQLEYKHSLYGVWQKEIYRLEESQLVLSSLFFEDYSAALYYDQFSLYTLNQINGGYVIKGLNIGHPLVRFAMAHGTQYFLMINSYKKVDLNAIFPSSTFLSLRVTKMSRAECLLREAWKWTRTV